MKPPTFIFGVDSQPTSSFDKWKARGINTFVRNEVEGGLVTVEQWAAEAAKRGMMQIRSPFTNLAADTDPLCLAWAHHDEPDNSGIPASVIQTETTTWKVAQPKRIAFCNFSSSALFAQDDVFYKPYVDATDWIGFDTYCVTGWNAPQWLDMQHADYPKYGIGPTIDRLTKLSGGKPILSYVECSDQNLGWVPNHRCVTPDEFRATIWTSIIHGVVGVVLFPQQIGGFFQFDVMPANIEAELKYQTEVIASFGTTLVGPSQFVANLPAPFEGRDFFWKTAQGVSHVSRWVLNLSPKSQVLNGVTYAPYDVGGYYDGAFVISTSTNPKHPGYKPPVSTPTPTPTPKTKKLIQVDLRYDDGSMDSLKVP